ANVLVPLMARSNTAPALASRLSPDKASLTGTDDWAWAAYDLQSEILTRDLELRRAFLAANPDLEEERRALVENALHGTIRAWHFGLSLFDLPESLRVSADFRATWKTLLDVGAGLWALAQRPNVEA